jgi:hypothetical protein
MNRDDRESWILALIVSIALVLALGTVLLVGGCLCGQSFQRDTHNQTEYEDRR